MISELVARTAHFIEDVVIPCERDERIGSHGPSDALVHEWRSEARNRGLIAPHLPSRWGGQGLCHAETAQLFRAAGYSPFGPVAMNIAAPDEGNMHLLDRVATEQQQARFLHPLATGTIRSTFLMTEPDGGAGSDPSLLRTEARRVGDDWLISGRKWLITGIEGAGFAIIMARTGESATMFLTDLPVPGLEIERVLDTLDYALPGGHAIVRLENVRVPHDQVLGEVGKGFRYAQVRLAPARLTHCMRWTGGAQRAHDIAATYACERMAFGKRLIEHEGVGFMLADNLIDLRQAELITDWCAALLDRGEDAAAASSMAKVAVSEALYRVADRSLQVLGGLGVTADTIVQHLFRELRAFRVYDGPSEVHRWSLAKRIERDHRQRLEA